MPGLLWANLSSLFHADLSDSLTAAGFSPAQINTYLQTTSEVQITRTHGRREGAFLNRAWEDVLSLGTCLDTSSSAQPKLDWAVNSRPSRCVGYEGLAPAAQRIGKSLKFWKVGQI